MSKRFLSPFSHFQPRDPRRSNTKPNALVRFDPATGRFQTFAIPSGGGVVRNMTPTADGRGLALACSGVNMVALVTIR